jgi:deazaflavin-dependent oxidoreductase (nitroreductase family)
MADIGRTMARGFMRTAVWLYRRSGGRIGGRVRGASVLLLTTTGRRSGRPWTVPVMYQGEGDGWVVIASNGGSDRHPAWWLNLRARPEGTVQVGAETFPVAATRVSGAERERLWRKMADAYPGYDAYLKKTDRKMPVVLLTRR